MMDLVTYARLVGAGVMVEEGYADDTYDNEPDAVAAWLEDNR